MSVPFTLPLRTDGTEPAELTVVGGKARALAILASADLPVPDGFIVSTTAYHAFVHSNRLQAPILERVDGLDIDDIDSIAGAATDIAARFERAALPGEVSAALLRACEPLEHRALAVRSSATAEDLPGQAFAGLHESYLNVRGTMALLVAVRNCWASLWTARAIAYRAKMGVDNSSIAMAVIVQVMLEPKASGVLFTANPTTGERTELMVNASFGLGEAVVGGLVTPDSFILERHSGTVKSSTVGSKSSIVVADEENGVRTENVSDDQRAQPSMTDAALEELAELGVWAESLLGGAPQDIEWALARGQCWLLQSRPITRLPAPLSASWLPPSDGAKLVRRQVVENMPAPLSPLFEELYLEQGLDRGMDQLVNEMGLPVNLDEFITRPMFVTVNGYGYCRYDIVLSWRTLRLFPRLLYWTIAAMPGWMRQLVPLWQDKGLTAYQATVAEWRALDVTALNDRRLLSGIRELAMADAAYWFYITLMVGAAKLTEGMLHGFLASRFVKGGLTSAMFLRGFDSQTLQAQLDLNAISTRAAATPATRRLVLDTEPDALLDILAQDAAGQTLLEDLQKYFATYGHQIYNLDFVEPTQADDPRPVLATLQTLVRTTAKQPDANPRTAMIETRKTLEQHTRESLGPLRRRLFGKLLNAAQTYAPYRESALFYMGAGWPTLRRMALELGTRLTDSGSLSGADDVFYLRSDELEQACGARAEQRARSDLAAVAQTNRTLRHQRQRLHPPGRVPEDLRFKLGPFDLTRTMEMWETQKKNADDAHILSGFAVSPGRVTGIASVILSPSDFGGMQPDSILVCPTTTPAWTPLFVHAKALVTDIGGMLAHGSIIAREYDIPAVLGTGNATARITSGQRITVDGTAGTVTLHV